MKLYGGRLINRQVRRQIADSRELRDAIVWDVTPASHYCRVKIQGSDTLVKAWYPENWEATPQYLKAGNAVRITHPGGNKGRIEVAGHGFLIPTAVPGGTGTPPATTAGDTVLTGLTISADGTSMSAMVATGTYRIGGVIYVLGAVEMDRTDIEMDRPDIAMDGVADMVSFDAASSTLFRIDLIVVGTDGDAHVVKGTNAASNPVAPTMPADHVLAGFVLLYPGMTVVSQADVNRSYTAPAPVELRIVTEDNDLAWGDLSTYFTISVRDQYGRILYGSYFVTVTFNCGNGTLSHSGDSSTTALVVAFSGTVNVTYTRLGLDPGDQTPVFTMAESVTGLGGAAFVSLRDGAGALM